MVISLHIEGGICRSESISRGAIFLNRVSTPLLKIIVVAVATVDLIVDLVVQWDEGGFFGD